MGETSIEWAHFTFQPWMGCQRVSPGCEHCYAESFAKRVGHGTTKPAIWGPGSERRMMSEAYWRAPLKWSRDAARDGVRRRVFCASMADVFEDRPELVEPRARLFTLISKTPSLDWLLLTKRPENAARLWSDAFHAHLARGGTVTMSWPRPGDEWTSNIWLGTTVEDQRRADERIPHLLAVPARVRFLSVEPMLGPITLPLACPICRGRGEVGGNRYDEPPEPCPCMGETPIQWVIVGGESGPGARPMHPQWARAVRDQCVEAGVSFLFKQIGDIDFDGVRVGKKAAGRLLDGVVHDGFPEVRR